MSDTERLTRMIRDAVNASGLRDPRAVTERVLKEMPDDFVEAALAVTLPGFVRQVMMEHRPSASNLPTVPPAPIPVPGLPSPVPAAPAPAPGFRPPSAGPDPTQQWAKVDPRPSPIAKTGGARTRGFHGGARYRDGWQRVLESYVIGSDGRERKKLRECTPEDIDAIAARLDQQADAAKARARGYREVARVMREQNAATVDALPAETKMDLFAQEAA